MNSGPHDNLAGNTLALVATGLDSRGEKEGAVWFGTARWANGHLCLHRGEGKEPFQFPDDVLDRIKPVPADFADILGGADYYIVISIDPLPEDANPEDYRETGLKWPD